MKAERKPRIVSLRVCLNGTDSNPHHRFGLTQNPFPQLGMAEYDAAERRLAKLGGDPIPKDRAEAYIRETLEGFSQEFVDGVVARYKPGEYVRFTVNFPLDR